MRKQQKKATRKDVAKMAGVSNPVVTYVMNGTAKEKRISQNTIDKVTKVALELHYSPSIWGQLINSQKSGLIAFLSPHLFDFGSSEIVRLISSVARKRKYGLILFDLTEEHFLDDGLNEELERTLADGFILHTPSDKMLEQCLENKFLSEKPMCVLGCNLAHKKTYPSVDVNNITGTRMALEHLLAKPTKRLGIISDSENYRYARERLKACRDILSAYPELDIQYYHSSNHGSFFEVGYNAVQKWHHDAILPDALFTTGDLIAIGAISFLNKQRINIASDIRIVGFDGSPLASYSSPPLTTVAQPFLEMTEAAIDQCISMIENKDIKNRYVKLPPKLIIRESS